MKRADSEQASLPPSLRCALKNDLEALAQATCSLEEFLQTHAAGSDACFTSILVLEEIVTNVIKYAYEDTAPHEILLEVRLSSGHVVIQVSDDGRDFNPLAVQLPDLEQPLEERPIGGLGVHLVRNLAESVEYQRAGGRNILTAFIVRNPKN